MNCRVYNVNEPKKFMCRLDILRWHFRVSIWMSVKDTFESGTRKKGWKQS